jgi:hypothetical protein
MPLHFRNAFTASVLTLLGLRFQALYYDKIAQQLTNQS